MSTRSARRRRRELRKEQPRVEIGESNRSIDEGASQQGSIVDIIQSANQQGQGRVMHSERNSEIQGTSGEVSRASSVISAKERANRKRRLEAEAAQEKIEIRRRAIEAQMALDLELVDQRLQMQLTECSDDEREDGTSQINQQERETSDTVQEWLASAHGPVDHDADHDDDTQVDNIEGRCVERGLPERQSTEAAILKATKAVSDLVQKVTDTLGTVRDYITPSMAAERVIQRVSNNNDLPKFDGKALEWLRFKRAFELSTELGGFTETENVPRLYKCLEGEAKEAVRSLMLTACDATQIMKTLELRFGNPDLVLESVIQEVKNMPKINSNNIDLVTFAVRVENCVAAMQALNQVGYLHSPELLRNVLEKMSSVMIYNYNRFVAEHTDSSGPKLIMLSKYLMHEAEMACKAGTNFVSRRTSVKRANEGSTSSSKKFRAQKASINVTGEDTASTCSKPSGRPNNSSKYAKRECTYCKNQGHFIDKCTEFRDKSVKERWRWAKSMRVCFVCLKSSHMRAKCKGRACQVGGCKGRHHALLHKSVDPASRNKSAQSIVSNTGEEATLASASNITNK